MPWLSRRKRRARSPGPQAPERGGRAPLESDSLPSLSTGAGGDLGQHSPHLKKKEKKATSRMWSPGPTREAPWPVDPRERAKRGSRGAAPPSPPAPPMPRLGTCPRTWGTYLLLRRSEALEKLLQLSLLSTLLWLPHVVIHGSLEFGGTGGGGPLLQPTSSSTVHVRGREAAAAAVGSPVC